MEKNTVTQNIKDENQTISYYEKNKEKIKKKRKIYQAKNKEKIKERNKIYEANNKEKIKERNKIYRVNNKEKIKELKQTYYENNKEQIKEQKKIYQENNKEQIKEQKKIYEENNKEKISNRKKIYYKDNKEKIDKTTKIYKTDNKEKIKEQKKIYQTNNKEKIKEQKKIYQENNKEQIKEQKKIYKKNNKEKITFVRQERLKAHDALINFLIKNAKAYDKKHDKKYDIECTIDAEYIIHLIEKQNNKCFYSNVELLWEQNSGSIYQVSIDRIDSSLGHIKGNCQLVTTHVNFFKNKLSHDDFVILIKNIKNNFYKISQEGPIKDLTKSANQKINTMFNQIKYRALKKYNKMYKDNQLTIKPSEFKLDFDKEYLNELRLKSGDRCALTNVELSWEPNQLNTASIDRIDSSKNYTKDNIQIILLYVNFMKQKISNEKTKQIIDDLINYNCSTITTHTITGL